MDPAMLERRRALLSAAQQQRHNRAEWERRVWHRPIKSTTEQEQPTAYAPEELWDDRPVYVGPLVGAELGHEIFLAAMVRHRARTSPNITVCTQPGREALYEDFCPHIIAHDIQCEGSVLWPINSAELPAGALAKWTAPPDAIKFPLQEYFGRSDQPAEFVPYGQYDADFAGVVVVHARQRGHEPKRNWPVENWAAALAQLRDCEWAKRIVSIGSLAAAAHVPGTEDLRGLPLRRQMDVLRSAKIAFGPSSGPMHLASLCGCPHVVWCGGSDGEQKLTMGRYQKTWNPFGTPCTTLPRENWHPAVEVVVAAVREMGARIAAGRASSVAVEAEPVGGPSRGVLYVAFGANYNYQAAFSARSVRKVSAVPICVLSNVPPAREWQGIPNVEFRHVDGENKDNRAVRTSMIKHTPFDYTLALDTDTAVRSAKFLEGFKLLEGHDFAGVAPEGSARAEKDLNMPIYREAHRELGYEFPVQLVNGGVLFFKKSPATEKFFARWHGAWAKLGRGRDMPALAWALQQQDMRWTLLPLVWNCPERRGDAIISHAWGKHALPGIPSVAKYKPDMNDNRKWLKRGGAIDLEEQT